MSILNSFRAKKKSSASIAKERLQIIISHERTDHKDQNADYIPKLQQEKIDVISKYVEVNRDEVKVDLSKSGDRSILELNIALPEA